MSVPDLKPVPEPKPREAKDPEIETLTGDARALYNKLSSRRTSHRVNGDALAIAYCQSLALTIYEVLTAVSKED